MSSSDEADLEPWKRLGRMLAARRIELAPKYRNRRSFAERAGISYRVLFDIEHGKRANFGANTLAAVEEAYGWQSGSIEDVLRGGDPKPDVAAEWFMVPPESGFEDDFSWDVILRAYEMVLEGPASRIDGVGWRVYRVGAFIRIEVSAT